MSPGCSFRLRWKSGSLAMAATVLQDSALYTKGSQQQAGMCTAHLRQHVMTLTLPKQSQRSRQHLRETKGLAKRDAITLASSCDSQAITNRFGPQPWTLPLQVCGVRPRVLTHHTASCCRGVSSLPVTPNLRAEKCTER
jgi:hypothetical protein